MRGNKQGVRVKRIEEIRNPPNKMSRCKFCGKNFKSHSQFDALCNVCWADSEMRPYFGARGLPGGSMLN